MSFTIAGISGQLYILRTMKFIHFIPICLFFQTLLNISNAQPRPGLSKEPQWVVVKDFPSGDPVLEDEAEDGYMDLLLDKQISIPESAIYIRKQLKILTESGIQNASQISVNFDPQYQTLSFHRIRIIRDGNAINQLNLSRMKVIQQEEDLHMHIYNGDLTAILFLEDVRKGDVIEYSYTIKGMNPVYDGKFSTFLSTNFQVPISNIYYRLICPEMKTLYMKNFHTDIQPAITEEGRNRFYEWKCSNVKAIRIEDNTPAWFDPFGSVAITEFKSWEDVNKWALKLFSPVTVVSPDLQKKIDEINNAGRSEEQKAILALRFVQDNIRYLGIEIGQSSHRPTKPDKIFSQRFGDCKDKSYLLCTILQKMGIDAVPVLINTDEKAEMKEWLPMAKAFDHTTVRVNIGGDIYWFDPTISLQRGGIKNISFPDYGYGLVIKDGTTDLTRIDSRDEALVVINEAFDLSDTGKAKLKVITEYHGSFADDVRNDFNNSSNYELRKTYKNFYARYYKDIVVDSLTHIDYDTTGVFSTIEYYTIKNIWELDGETKKSYFNPFVIDGLLRKPKEKDRTMPYRLTYPCKYLETIEIVMPEEWSGESSTKSLETPDLVLKANYFYNHKKFMLRYEYQSLNDHVSPEKIDEYLQLLDEKDNSFTYELSQQSQKKNSNLFVKKNVGPLKDIFYPTLVISFIIGGIYFWRRTRS